METSLEMPSLKKSKSKEGRKHSSLPGLDSASPSDPLLLSWWSLRLYILILALGQVAQLLFMAYLFLAMSEQSPMFPRAQEPSVGVAHANEEEVSQQLQQLAQQLQQLQHLIETQPPGALHQGHLTAPDLPADGASERGAPADSSSGTSTGINSNAAGEAAATGNAQGTSSGFATGVIGSEDASGLLHGSAALPLPPSDFTPLSFNSCALQSVGGRGSDNYGSWKLCINQVPPNSVIYSFGLGGDVSFDLEMLARGHQVFGFDPTTGPDNVFRHFHSPRERLLQNFTFVAIGLGAVSGVPSFMQPPKGGSFSSLPKDPSRNYTENNFRSPVLTLPDIMRSLGHGHVDLVKMDVEGIECDVCESAPFLESLPRVGQLLVEFHRLAERDPGSRQRHCEGLLFDHGFRIAKRTVSQEYTFARLTPDATTEISPKAPLVVT